MRVDRHYLNIDVTLLKGSSASQISQARSIDNRLREAKHTSINVQEREMRYHSRKQDFLREFLS